jgi:hypothetical protein
MSVIPHKCKKYDEIFPNFIAILEIYMTFDMSCESEKKNFYSISKFESTIQKILNYLCKKLQNHCHKTMGSC